MTSDEYLQNILNKYEINIEGAEKAGQAIYPTIQKWAGNHLVKAEFSGSLAKGTAISLSSDADIFISISSYNTNTLSEIYSSLHSYVTSAGYTARKQNVSIGLDVEGYKIDLVPGKRQSQHGNDHSLYKHKTSTWTKTNVHTHIDHVQNSGRIQEIKLAKIWRARHNLDFPSFYLELATMNALKNKSKNDLANNFMTVLNFLANDFVNKIYIDPANTNNTISDDLTLAEKKNVAAEAASSIKEQYWENIVW